MLPYGCLNSQEIKNYRDSSIQLEACSRRRVTAKLEAIKRMKQRGWLKVQLDLCNPFGYNRNGGDDDGGLYCMRAAWQGDQLRTKQKTTAEQPQSKRMWLSRCEWASARACRGAKDAGEFGIIKMMPVS